MRTAELALAIAGLVCFAVGLILTMADAGARSPRTPVFWGCLGGVLCQVLWLLRL